MFGLVIPGVDEWQHELAKRSVLTLQIMIVAWAVFIISIVWFIDNPWILAGIFLYEVLP